MRILVIELPSKLNAFLHQWVNEKIRPDKGYDELDVETFLQGGQLVVTALNDILRKGEYWNHALLNEQLQNALYDRQHESGTERTERLKLEQVYETTIAELEMKLHQQVQLNEDIMLELKSSDSKGSVSRNVLRGFPVTARTIKQFLLERIELKRQIRDLQRLTSRDIRLAGDRNTRKALAYVLDKTWPEWKKIDWIRNLSTGWALGIDNTQQLLDRAELEVDFETRPV